MGQPLTWAAAGEWGSRGLRDVMCAVNGRARDMEPLKAFGAQESSGPRARVPSFTVRLWFCPDLNGAVPGALPFWSLKVCNLFFNLQRKDLPKRCLVFKENLGFYQIFF